MVIMSAKVSKRKVLTASLWRWRVVVLLAVLLGKAGEAPAASVQESAAAEIDAGSNEGRVAFLQSFGWEVAETPVETQEVKIPVEFNNVFTRYNQLQQSQGYDLSQYAGKGRQALRLCPLPTIPRTRGRTTLPPCWSTGTRSSAATSPTPARVGTCTALPCLRPRATPAAEAAPGGGRRPQCWPSRRRCRHRR